MKKIVFMSVVITALVVCTAAWFYSEEVKQEAYDNGYDIGYGKGYIEGFDIGYDDGYQDGANESDNDLGYLTSDTAPYGTVWTTPSGEKYHEGWCRYVSGGRTDLTYFLSAEEAMDYGYTPCSVCH